jgi:ABC-type uncharacterized transport system auxiliary subunit
MKTILERRRPRPSGQIVSFSLSLVLVMMVLSGCGLGGKPSYLVRQYVLEYPSPMIEAIAQSGELLKVERFSTAREYDTHAMIYREGPYQRGVDPYNRWRVNPGDMVTDHLLRDLRKAGLFKAVFSYNDGEETRYLLEGQVLEFLESKEKDGRKAVFDLNVTLQDLAKKEVPERIVFQRHYRYTEPLELTTCECLAQAMSKAMETFSRQLMMDLSKAVGESKK